MPAQPQHIPTLQRPRSFDGHPLIFRQGLAQSLQHRSLLRPARPRASGYQQGRRQHRHILDKTRIRQLVGRQNNQVQAQFSQGLPISLMLGQSQRHVRLPLLLTGQPRRKVRRRQFYQSTHAVGFGPPAFDSLVLSSKSECGRSRSFPTRTCGTFSGNGSPGRRR